uniref:Ubiquinol-cytochrome c reductase complex assembly factor 1 n=1 Tax=Myotis myotis TaxID=51298 RepID=A0A7J7W261_MYOMY|nr:ubiquinol-cytochrome c reductase complex assembly factor 1 [Myotis myotis]
MVVEETWRCWCESLGTRFQLASPSGFQYAAGWYLCLLHRDSGAGLCLAFSRMCLVRMKQEGRTGKYMCRIIVHFMWEDVEQRGRVMGVNPYILKKNMMVMTNNFYAAILGYDEGILSDDHGLAAALWRTFFNQKCEDPRQLELLVEYVRKQIQYLDSMNGEDLLLTGEVSWRPLVEKNPQSVLKPHSPVYNDEGL